MELLEFEKMILSAAEQIAELLHLLTLIRQHFRLDQSRVFGVRAYEPLISTHRFQSPGRQEPACVLDFRQSAFTFRQCGRRLLDAPIFRPVVGDHLLHGYLLRGFLT